MVSAGLMLNQPAGYRPQKKFAKLCFYTCLSVHRDGGHAWQGRVAWQGDMHGRGCA